ncbi:glycerophosphodiester phosphodiesterase [Hanamia caeni]|uniref:Glycerophosphodiester phosphodiesterase n=1 Tax=Hanamia caeni TaxID=2294116 RepID=A0A3M9N3R9_9BACT|nr:glycerophosphodiester phosphodiesterase family protein [Hanamia caeni]RNI31843.1 glycerophosphodiester phosphodiesterase [Hanamia caeni]
MKYTKLFFALFMALLVSCSETNQHKDDTAFDRQAHRGGRGLMPENTIVSEKNAIDYDCTMEMDLQMTKDKKIVVSHDAYFSSDFSLTPEGDTMTKEDGRSRLIYNMPYDSVAKYDVGLKPHPGFPRQKKIHAVRPLLSTLIDSVEAYAKTKNHVNHYNIELKTSPADDGKAYSNLQEYVDSAMKIIIDKGIAPRTMIQSFDVRALRIVHDKYPKIETSFLVMASNKKTVEGYIDELGFKPDVFSPQYTLLTPELVTAFHKEHIKVIPWTPNTLGELQKLKDMGVDGAITDYPELYAELK